MKLEERAKIFLPYDALRGYYDIINKVTREKIERKFLDEEGLVLLNKKLMCLRKGILITVTHYDNDAYIETSGLVSRISKEGGFLEVVKTRIYFKDIIDITGEDIKIDYYEDI